MALIFSASTAAGSSGQTSRILGPMLEWLFPAMPAETVERCVGWIRKAAHVVEYAVLAMLLWRALRQMPRLVPSPASPLWPCALTAWCLSVLYAITDECHQLLVPSRTGSLWDVCLDSLGAGLGLMMVWVFERRRGGRGRA